MGSSPSPFLYTSLPLNASVSRPGGSGSAPEPLLPHALVHHTTPRHEQERHPRDGRPLLSAFLLRIWITAFHPGVSERLVPKAINRLS